MQAASRNAADLGTLTASALLAAEIPQDGYPSVVLRGRMVDGKRGVANSGPEMGEHGRTT